MTQRDPAEIMQNRLNHEDSGETVRTWSTDQLKRPIEYIWPLVLEVILWNSQARKFLEKKFHYSVITLEIFY